MPVWLLERVAVLELEGVPVEVRVPEGAPVEVRVPVPVRDWLAVGVGEEEGVRVCVAV